MADLLNHITSLGITPRRVSTADGGEYASSCPACGDGGKGARSDRFHVWPAKEGGGLCVGRYWCRRCDISGDAIEFLKQFHNMDFRSACEELGVSLPDKGNHRPARYTPPAQQKAAQASWQPRTYGDPPALWQQKAGAMLADCRARLAAEPEAIAWLEQRGLTRAMIDTYGLGYNQSSRGGDRYRQRSAWGLAEKIKNGKPAKLWLPRGWVIPSFGADGGLQQLRIRRLDEDIARFADHIKYLPVDGSSMATMVIHPEAEVFVVVECGFDALLIAGSLHGKVGAVTTWNVSARPDARTHRLLSRAALILNGLDHDKAGDEQQGWWNAAYKHNRRLPCPGENIGDPGEAYAAGVDIAAWVSESLPRGLRIKLGFAGNKAAAQEPAAQVVETPAEADPELEGREDAITGGEVLEMDLSNGTTIYITDDQARWQELTDQGKPVFSRNELARLHQATEGMSGPERLAAAMQAIEVKLMFGGYVRAGRPAAVREQQKEEAGDGEQD